VQRSPTLTADRPAAPIASRDRPTDRALLRTGLLLGVGLVGTLDEVVLHQLLQWHNFYVHADQYWRIVSDGLFHLVSSTLLFVGALRLWRDRQSLSRRGRGRRLAAGIVLGMGAFNLYDGLIQHKLLQLHQVREGVANQLPYDLAFNGLAVLLLIIGWRLLRASKRGELL
jgi:uncharacterized membrane protein